MSAAPRRDLDTVSQGVMLKSLVTALGGVLTLGLSIIMTRHFGRERFSALVLVFSVANLVPVLSEFGAKSTLSRFMPPAFRAKDTVRAGVLVRSALLLQSAGLLVIAGAMAAAAPLLAAGFFRQPELTGLFRLGAVYAAGLAVVDFLLVLFQSLEQWRSEALISLAYWVTYFSCSLLLVLVAGAGLEGVLVANIVAVAVMLLVALRRLPQALREAAGAAVGTQTAAGTREALRFGGPLVLINVNFMLMMWFDKALLGRYGRPADLTAYYIGFLFLNAMMSFIKVLFTVLMPFLARLDRTADVVAERFNQLFRWFLHFSVLCAFLAYVVVAPVIARLYGPGYELAILSFRLALGLFILRTAYQPVGMFIVNVFGQTKLSLMVCLLHTVLMVALNMALVPIAGVRGAIAANTLAYAGFWVASMVAFRQIRGIIDRRLWLAEAAALAGAGAMWWVCARVSVGSTITCAATALVYGGILVATNAWGARDWSLLRSLAGSLKRGLAVQNS